MGHVCPTCLIYRAHFELCFFLITASSFAARIWTFCLLRPCHLLGRQCQTGTVQCGGVCLFLLLLVCFGVTKAKNSPKKTTHTTHRRTKYENKNRRRRGAGDLLMTRSKSYITSAYRLIGIYHKLHVKICNFIRDLD